MYGDLFTEHVTRFCNELSVPLESIFNTAFQHETWPAVWQTEVVTCIPKCNDPESLSQLRNLSCTPLYSKVMEYFVLENLKQSVKPDFNQFGGLSGNSTNHYLIQAWDEILESLDQDGAVVNLISIDFENAFNSMNHRACLEKFVDKGCCPHLVRMNGAFLKGRTTKYKIGRSHSASRPLGGGSPQGTLLGNYMFIITTDHLENTLTDGPTLVGDMEDIEIERSLSSSSELSQEEDKDDQLCTDPFRRTINRICDTPDRDETQHLDRSVMNYHFPRPANWKYRKDCVIKFVDDFLGVEK